MQVTGHLKWQQEAEKLCGRQRELFLQCLAGLGHARLLLENTNSPFKCPGRLCRAPVKPPVLLKDVKWWQGRGNAGVTLQVMSNFYRGIAVQLENL